MEGYFLWSHLRMPLTWRHWLPGQPSNSNLMEDCAEMHFQDGKWGWNDHKCDRRTIADRPIYALCEADVEEKTLELI